MSNPYASPPTTQPASGAPSVRPVSWPAAFVNLSVLIAILFTGWIITRSFTGIWIGAAIYLAYSLGSRFLIARAHRTGIQLVQCGQHERAISAFEDSFHFFSRHAWLDRYRAFTMLSPAAMSYREMALCNIGFCHSQLGQGAQAKEAYRLALAEYPGNKLATIALRMIESGEQIAAASKNGSATF